MSTTTITNTQPSCVGVCTHDKVHVVIIVLRTHTYHAWSFCRSTCLMPRRAARRVPTAWILLVTKASSHRPWTFWVCVCARTPCLLSLVNTFETQASMCPVFFCVCAGDDAHTMLPVNACGTCTRDALHSGPCNNGILPQGVRRSGY